MKMNRRIFGVLAVAIIVASPIAHAQDNLRDAAPFNGYTGEVFDTTHYAYDYLVDSSLPQDDPANKKFKTLQAAYAAAPAGTPDKPTVIGIKPDVYQIAGTKTEAGITITKNYITLLGLTDDRRKVVLADNRGNGEGASNNGYLMIVNANGFTVMNLTIVNYCNLDYEYPGDPSKDLKMRSPVVTQAVAMQSDGDKHVYSHVAFLGRLDTLFIRTTRSYFTNVFVEGTDDFIGGGTVGVWENSEVYFPTGNGVMSSSGITFIHTVFKAKRGLEFYKGFRNPVTLIDCTLPVNTPHSKVAWIVWKAPVHQNLYSLTYHTKDAAGHPAVIADSILGAPAFTLSREISAQEAAAFNPWNLLRAVPATGVVDDWDPAGVREKYAKQGTEVFRMAFANPAATPAPGALLGPFTPAAPPPPTIRTGGAGATFKTTVMPARAQDQPITWSTTSKLISLSATTGPSITVTGRNTTNHAEFAAINAKAEDGYYITARVNVEPAFIAPPAFLKKPVLLAPAAGKVKLSYTLDLGGGPAARQDQSLITWYLCDDAACTTRRTVAVSRGDLPLRQYTLTTGAIGKYIEAGIQPKHNISDPGAEILAIAAHPITAKDLPTANVAPDFRNFVVAENTNYVSGMWTLLGTWTSVLGDNGYGIRVGNAGAALLYQQDAPTTDMTVKVVMTPEKTAGQGFGIAGTPDDPPKAPEKNQKADIYIKYDPRTRTGYSLRFWRTILSGEKCMFQLYRIVDGIGAPISDQQQLTGVFKPDTTITLSIVGNLFTARGSNTTDGETLSLHGVVTPNDFGGAGASWSGSTPVGNSVIFSRFEIAYPVRPKGI